MTAIPVEAIARHLDRQITAIIAKANKMGLYRVGKGYVKHFPDPFAAATPESMWALGLWYTDGHIASKHQVVLTQKDRTVLEQVRDLIASPSLRDRVKIAPYQGKSQAWTLKIGSMQMVQYLASYGVHPRKSRTMLFPAWIPAIVLSHFVRGLWDGDGYIGRKKHSSNLVATYACGSLSFITGFARIVNEVIGHQLTIYKQRRHECFTFSMSGSRAETFLEWLYRDSLPTMRMHRKYAVYQQSSSTQRVSEA